LADEKLTWSTLVASGVAEHFANSLIALARKGQGSALWSDERLAVMFASDRQPEFAVRSEVRGTDGGLQFARSALYPHRASSADDDRGIRHAPAEHEPVVAGRELLQVVLDHPDERADLLRRWAALVPDEQWAPVDLVPHNLILTDDDRLVAIDQEWHVRGYERDVLLLRGLVLTAEQMAGRTRAERLRPHETVLDLVTAMAQEIELSVTDELIDRFCEREAGFQAAVNTTDSSEAERRHRSAQDLRSLLSLPLDDVRGGLRFDFQWARARSDIDQLNLMITQQKEQAEGQRVALEHDLAVYRKAHDEAQVELQQLRSRQPLSLARRVARRVLAGTGALRR